MAPAIGIGVGVCFAGNVRRYTPLDSAPKLLLLSDVGVTESGGAVSAWADQSGNAHDFAQGTPAAQPAYSATGFNGHPSCAWDGTNTYMLIPSHDDFNVGVGSWLCMAAIEFTADGSDQCVFGKSSNALADNFRCFRLQSALGDKLVARWGSDAEEYGGGTAAIANNVAAVCAWGVDATSNEVIEVAAGTQYRRSITVSGTGSNSQVVCLGFDVSGGRRMAAKLAALMFINRGAAAIGAKEVDNAIWYFESKFGL